MVLPRLKGDAETRTDHSCVRRGKGKGPHQVPARPVTGEVGSLSLRKLIFILIHPIEPAYTTIPAYEDLIAHMDDEGFIRANA